MSIFKLKEKPYFWAMAKVKTTYYCQNCGQQHAQWQGQCSNCKQWNTIEEEVLQKNTKATANPENSTRTLPQKISEISSQKENRLWLEDEELNRVLGGGLVPGSMVLLGGEPGIGKSTLLLQASLREPKTTLYVSGEESAQQIKSRAERISGTSDEMFIFTETDVAVIIQKTLEIKPSFLVIDSIQTLSVSYIDSSPGSISQIRESTAELLKMAKKSNIPVFLIGHINKEGHIAGPKILEHMVDVVLQFEGDNNHTFRILRTFKNRFGNTNELGIYEMQQEGLVAIENPSEILLSQNDKNLSGSSVACTMEGIRPLLIEVQALVSTAVYGTPQRSSTGYDAKRLNMLLAVLEKRAGFQLGSQDVFLNLTGGIKIEDTALDLAVVAAVLSSGEDRPLPDNVCYAGEIGLNGEIRPVPRLEQRISEAEKLGFDVIFISKNSKINTEDYKIVVRPIATIGDLVRVVF